MKKAFYVAVLIILVVLLAFAFRLASPQDQKDPVLDFSETGHLVRDNPGLKPGAWYLVYEKPGAPALTVELKFTGESACSFNGRPGDCPEVVLPSSALTTVEGLREGNLVTVSNLYSGTARAPGGDNSGSSSSPLPPPTSGNPGSPDSEAVFCTMDARMCPDGSYVGRVGPKCEFAPCPSLNR